MLIMASDDLERKLVKVAEVIPDDIRNPYILKRWIIKLIAPNGNLDTHLVGVAIDLGVYAHEAQNRESGEPYITHPLQVGCILAYISADSQTIAAGILHDSVEDTLGARRAEIITRVYAFLGRDVLKLVLQVSDVQTYENIFNLIKDPDLKSLLREFKREVLSEDPKVAAIEVGDGLSNLLTLDGLKPSYDMPAEQRRANSVKTTRERILPFARIVDETYKPSLKIHPYMERLLAQEEAKLTQR